MSFEEIFVRFIFLILGATLGMIILFVLQQQWKNSRGEEFIKERLSKKDYNIWKEYPSPELDNVENVFLKEKLSKQDWEIYKAIMNIEEMGEK